MVQTLTIILTSVTAAGAIWAALAGTRQARASSVQARLAEKALAEQVRSVRQQDEHARLTLELEILFKLEDRFDSPSFMAQRRKAANYVKENHFYPGAGMTQISKIEYLNETTAQVLNFFDDLGRLVELKAVNAETVQHRFGYWIQLYWALYETAIRNTRKRKERGGQPVYEYFEQLNTIWIDSAQQGSGEARLIPNEALLTLVETESHVGEDIQE